MSEALYEILTVEVDGSDEWTHQHGMPPNPIPRSQLKAALYRLRELGYSAHYGGNPMSGKEGDPFVRVTRIQ